jgi:hypothetical protein
MANNEFQECPSRSSSRPRAAHIAALGENQLLGACRDELIEPIAAM